MNAPKYGRSLIFFKSVLDLCFRHQSVDAETGRRTLLTHYLPAKWSKMGDSNFRIRVLHFQPIRSRNQSQSQNIALESESKVLGSVHENISKYVFVVVYNTQNVFNIDQHKNYGPGLFSRRQFKGQLVDNDKPVFRIQYKLLESESVSELESQ